jgi:dolichol-phosphate mannosyltransferase
VDPLSGFFAIDRRVIDGVKLRPEGYKILLEVLVRGAWRSVVEVPHELEARLHGESKARLWQGLAFAHHLGRLVRGSPSNQRMRNDLVLPAAASGDCGHRTLATSWTRRRAPGTSR